MTSIRFENVSKQFTGAQPLKEVSFKIQAGEFFVLVGPSGCGKSTLLRIIAGLETLSKGSVFFDDKNVTNMAPKDRDVGMVFQNYALYPHLSVFNNLAFPLSIRNLDKQAIKERVTHTAELLRLTEVLDRKPKQLSGGQRQRVAVGRAIIRKPRVFLFDEPLSNLDAQLRTHMRAELRTLQQSLGVTTVYVTHDQMEAMTMSDRMAILHEGALQQVGTPIEIYSRPANTFVARFTGNPPMNLIPVDGKLLGIRPEHLSTAEIGDSTPLSIQPQSLEYIGGEWLMHGVCNEASVTMRSASAVADWSAGGTVRLYAPHRYSCWF